MDNLPIVEGFRRELTEMQREIAALDERSKSNVKSFEDLRNEIDEETGKILIAYKSEVSELKTEITSLKKELDSVYTTIQRFRGGIVSIVALGSVVGWFISQWQGIRSLLGKG